MTPRDTGALQESIKVSTRAVGRRSRSPQVFIGTDDPARLAQEFGTAKVAAQPFLRPAFDEKVQEAAAIVQADLREEVERTVERARKRREKKAAT